MPTQHTHNLAAALDPMRPAFWYFVLTALACGGLIGLERQLRGKPAGIRTSALICLGSAVYVRLGAVLQADNADPSRVVGQVVTGIGFLGAGVILTQGGLVLGVTSAAVVWTLAAIGSTVGLGYPSTALALAGVTVGVLVGVQLLEKAFLALRSGVHSESDSGTGDDPGSTRRPSTDTPPPMVDD